MTIVNRKHFPLRRCLEKFEVGNSRLRAKAGSQMRMI